MSLIGRFVGYRPDPTIGGPHPALNDLCQMVPGAVIKENL